MSFIIDNVTTPQFSMAYCRFGHGKQPMVILPGLSVQSVLSAAAAIENQYTVFCDDFTVYLFDRRDNLPPVYTVEAMAEDTAAAIEVLGLQGCCLFGTSQGGMIAMTIAARHPSLVSKLALGSTAARMDKSSSAVINNWVTLAKEKKAEQLYLAFGEQVYPPTMFRQYEAVLTMMAKTVTEAELARFVTLAGHTEGFDLTGELTNIQCPVYLTGDTEDRVLGKEATYIIAERLGDRPDFTLRMYEGYGHAAYDTAPHYTQDLYTFFKG